MKLSTHRSTLRNLILAAGSGTLLLAGACGKNSSEIGDLRRNLGNMLGLVDEIPAREAFLMISKEALLHIISTSIDETHDVSDSVAGVSVTATGRTTGKVGINMIPDETQARFDAIIDLSTHLEIAGQHRPQSDIEINIVAVANSTSRTTKSFSVNLERAKGFDPQVTADTTLEVTGLEVNASGWFAGMKRRRAMEQTQATIARELPTQRANLEDRIAGEIKSAVNERAGQFLLNFNATLVKTFREWFSDTGYLPGKQVFQTTGDALWFSAVPDSQINGPELGFKAPRRDEGFVGDKISPLMLGISENAMEHAVEKALGGKTMPLAAVSQALVAAGALAPPSLWSTIQYSNIMATFPANKPVRLKFRDGKLHVTVHFEAIRQGAIGQAPSALELTYEPRLADDRNIEFVRVGEARVVGGPASPEANFLLSLVQTTINPGLHGKFLLPFPDLSGVIPALKELRLDFVRIEDGWIRLGASFDAIKNAGNTPADMPSRG
ncbi:MAG: hypothetical protein RIQ81_1897 [Pseudomonadota bacterium]|jgi:hypothetical protein